MKFPPIKVAVSSPTPKAIVMFVCYSYCIPRGSIFHVARTEAGELTTQELLA